MSLPTPKESPLERKVDEIMDAILSEKVPKYFERKGYAYGVRINSDFVMADSIFVGEEPEPAIEVAKKLGFVTIKIDKTTKNNLPVLDGPEWAVGMLSGDNVIFVAFSSSEQEANDFVDNQLPFQVEVRSVSFAEASKEEDFKVQCPEHGLSNGVPFAVSDDVVWTTAI